MRDLYRVVGVRQILCPVFVSVMLGMLAVVVTADGISYAWSQSPLQTPVPGHSPELDTPKTAQLSTIWWPLGLLSPLLIGALNAFINMTKCNKDSNFTEQDNNKNTFLSISMYWQQNKHTHTHTHTYLYMKSQFTRFYRKWRIDMPSIHNV